MSFYTAVIQQDARFNSTDRIADLALLEPVTRAAVQAILAASAVPLMVFETYRSEARQAQLFAKGVTQLRQVGVHGFGLACDIVREVDGQPSWAGDFSFLRALAERYGLIWGGDWGDSTKPHAFRDYDHVQRINLVDQDRLFAGAWYPDDGYRPVVK